MFGIRLDHWMTMLVNIITHGVLMAEALTIHVSSVFTREDTSSIVYLYQKHISMELRGKGLGS